MKYCPSCNKEYASDAAKFCNICGTALVDKNSSENSNEGTGTICPHCGKQISGDQTCCSFCGADLKPTENGTVTDSKKKDSNSKTTLIVIIVAVAAVIVAIGIRVYNNFRQEPETNQSVSTTQSSVTHDYEVNANAENNKDNTTNSNIDVTTTVPATTANDKVQISTVPSELKRYEKGLVFEGRTYRITLQSDDWYINYRSEPEYIDISVSDNNIVGKMKSGSEIYVEYIYNKTWAVFKVDGEYVFSSLYGSNDPTKNKLMEPKNDTIQGVINNTPNQDGSVLSSGPSSYSDKITVLSEGTTVTVMSTSTADGYVFIRTADGVYEGWILEKYLLIN